MPCTPRACRHTSRARWRARTQTPSRAASCRRSPASTLGRPPAGLYLWFLRIGARCDCAHRPMCCGVGKSGSPGTEADDTFAGGLHGLGLRIDSQRGRGSNGGKACRRSGHGAESRFQILRPRTTAWPSRYPSMIVHNSNSSPCAHKRYGPLHGRRRNDQKERWRGSEP